MKQVRPHSHSYTSLHFFLTDTFIIKLKPYAAFYHYRALRFVLQMELQQPIRLKNPTAQRYKYLFTFVQVNVSVQFRQRVFNRV